MRHYLTAALMMGALLCPLTASAQKGTQIKTISSNTCPGTGCVIFGTRDRSAIGISIRGTYSGTITFKGTSFDDHSTDCSHADFTATLAYPVGSSTPASTTTGTGNWRIPGGISYLCAVFTNYVSGSATIGVYTSQSAMSLSFGTGGSGSGSGDALVADPLSQFASTTPDQLAGVVATTGTGNFARATSPTFVTPTLGAATVTTVNKVTITAPATAATLTIPNNTTFTTPTSSGTAATLGLTQTFTGDKTFTGAVDMSTVSSVKPFLIVGSLPGTCAAGASVIYTAASNSQFLNICNADGAHANTWTAIGAGAGDALTTGKLSQFAATTSAELASTLSDETGSSGGFVRSGTPTITTPVITVPTIASFASANHDHTNSAGGGNITGTAFGSQSAGLFMASPTASSGNMTPRALVVGDLPQTVTENALTTGSTLSTYDTTNVVTCVSVCTQVLPTAVSHTGATLDFRIGRTSAVVTLDGNSAETVGGLTTLKLLPGEDVLLVAAGSNWEIKLSHRIAAICWMSLAGAQSVDAVVKVAFDHTVKDNAGMADTTNHRCNIIRPGNYRITGNVGYQDGGLQGVFSHLSNNACTAYYGKSRPISNGMADLSMSGSVPDLTTSDNITVCAGADNTTVLRNGTFPTGDGVPTLFVEEVLQ